MIQPFKRYIQHEVDVYIAASSGRQLAKIMGFLQTDQARIEIVILELAWNILNHSESGEILVQPVERTGLQGLEIIATDRGPGIPDPDLALQDGYSTTKTLGAGLPGVRRLMDEFELQSRTGEGTTVRTTRWLQRSSRRHP